MDGLRKRIYRAGTYLVTRQLLSTLIGVGNIFILTRLIGPRDYGLYAAALGLIVYLSTVGRLGIDVYLIRQGGDPSIHAYRQAYSAMACLATIAVMLGLASVPLLGRWYQHPIFIPPFLAMLITIPLNALASPTMAKFERNLNYRAVAAIDLSAQLAFCLVAIVLAYCKKGVWAPVTAYIVSQTIALMGSCILSRSFPRFYWSWPLLRKMLRYGVSYSVSMWIWQLRYLVNPLIVGRFGGPEGVGFVALAIRLTEQLSFVRGVAWQLSIPALAKLQGDYRRLKGALEEAMALQTVLLGPILAGFALLGPLLFPLFFGERWSPIFVIYPFISLGVLLNAVFNMHSSALYVLKRNWAVSVFHLSHILLFTTSAYLLVQRFDILGYGLAEGVALLSYGMIHIQVMKLFRLSYSKVLPWIFSFAPLLFTAWVRDYWGIALGIPLLIVLLSPAQRKQAIQYFRWGKTVPWS